MGLLDKLSGRDIRPPPPEPEEKQEAASSQSEVLRDTAANLGGFQPPSAERYVLAKHDSSSVSRSVRAEHFYHRDVRSGVYTTMIWFSFCLLTRHERSDFNLATWAVHVECKLPIHHP